MNLTKIENAIALCYPELIVDSISYLGEGEFCAAYLINDNRIFRLAKNKNARTILKREYCLLPKLAERITLAIPSPQFIDLKDKTDLSFMVYALLPGEALSLEKYLSLKSASRSICARQIAHFLNELHAIEVSIAEDCGAVINDYGGIYASLLAEARRNLFPILAESECLFIERVIGDYLKSEHSSKYRQTLLHGDLSPGHVIFGEKAQIITGIIDFGDVMIGDPAWDFLMIYEDYGLDFLARLLPEYCESDKTDLLRRVFQFSLLEAIERAVSAQAAGGNTFAQSLKRIRTLSVQEKYQLKELLSISSPVC